MRHYDWVRLLQSGGGRAEFEVVNRAIEYDGKVYNIGDPWPLVDLDDRGPARIARMFYEQRRLMPTPEWMLRCVPGAEKWLTHEELERATRPDSEAIDEPINLPVVAIEPESVTPSAKKKSK